MRDPTTTRHSRPASPGLSSTARMKPRWWQLIPRRSTTRSTPRPMWARSGMRRTPGMRVGPATPRLPLSTRTARPAPRCQRSDCAPDQKEQGIQMSKPLLWETLLLATALAAGTSLAESPQDPTAPADDAGADDSELTTTEEGVDVAMPGVTVTGYRTRNIQKATTEVISVLSNEDIARTGEGDIAGALSRVTGLSVVGNGFVYVRGLGDRYSLALLNGSPLPSPEPMRRAIPLDLFPTNVVASSLVQKTYSPTFTGEFGGGVINLTTISSPKTPFFSAGLSLSGDTETTDNLGYDYYGGKNDWTGYDSGLRDTPPALAAFFASGERMSSGAVDSGDIAKEFARPDNALVQRLNAVPFNYSGNISAGDAWLIGESDSRLGLIGTAGFSNSWRTRDILEQT